MKSMQGKTDFENNTEINGVETINGIKCLTDKTTGEIFTVPRYACVKSDSVIEVGKYIDFHGTKEYSEDYPVGLHVDGTELTTNATEFVIKNEISMERVLPKSLIASNGTNYNKIEPTSIDIHNSDGAHWKMKCYTGDSGIGRISFEDLNKGDKVRIDPATGYTKLNKTTTHNTPFNEDINAFQLDSPIFTTGLIYRYDLSVHSYVIDAESTTDCISSVKTTCSYSLTVFTGLGVPQDWKSVINTVMF